jgi:hypothetical protein
VDSLFINMQLVCLVERIFPHNEQLLCVTEAFIKNRVITGHTDVYYSSRERRHDACRNEMETFCTRPLLSQISQYQVLVYI